MEPQASKETTGAVAPGSGRWSLPADGPLLAVVIYLLGLSVYLSSRRMMWLDEFFAWGVLTDPSLIHAMHAWLEGADSGGILYYILGHTLLAITGPKVLAARLFGAALFAGAYVLWFRVLRRVFAVRVAWVASGVLLISVGCINYLAEVRFYPQLIAAVVLAVWSALWAQRAPRSPAYVFAVLFVVHGALVTSHLLGVVYSAMVLVSLLACARPKRYIAAAAGIVVSWSLLLSARRPIHIGGLRVAGMRLAPPHWNELLGVYRLQPSALSAVNVLLYLLLAVTALLWLGRSRGDRPFRDDPRSLLIRISLLLGAAPALFFAESWVAPWPLWVVRYMLPGIVGISGLTAFLLDYQTRQAWALQLSSKTRNLVFVAALAGLAACHVVAVRRQVLRPEFADAQLKPLDRGLPVVVADEQLFFQLKQYESRSLPQLYYVHVPLVSMAGEQNDLMRTIERQGYWGGGLRTREEFLPTVSDFLLLESSGRDADLVASLQRNGWTVALLGTQVMEGKPTSLLRLTRSKT